jgi:hypothetical protein
MGSPAAPLVEGDTPRSAGVFFARLSNTPVIANDGAFKHTGVFFAHLAGVAHLDGVGLAGSCMPDLGFVRYATLGGTGCRDARLGRIAFLAGGVFLTGFKTLVITALSLFGRGFLYGGVFLTGFKTLVIILLFFGRGFLYGGLVLPDLITPLITVVLLGGTGLGRFLLCK